LVLIATAFLSLAINACVAIQPDATTTPSSGGMTDMDHSAMNKNSEVAFDATFIDSMIEHHRGAITMAEQALENSERSELRSLAEAIIAAQTTEIEEMQQWREAWFPDLAPTDGMEMGMGEMSISTDESTPFDQRFIEAMISHHQGAIDMAEMALEMSERDEIRELAETIIATQSAEIEQMRNWLEEWYNITE
jgi:uncharacterized protein (DUF305 family)